MCHVVELASLPRKKFKFPFRVPEWFGLQGPVDRQGLLGCCERNLEHRAQSQQTKPVTLQFFAIHLSVVYIGSFLQLQRRLFCLNNLFKLLEFEGCSESAYLYIHNSSFSFLAGWTMIFKLVSGVSANIYQLWTSADSLNENETEALNVNPSFKEHYKNRFVQNWQTAKPKEVDM